MRLKGLVLTLFIYTSVTAQENSPYSRYGLGDLVPNQNILNRGIGGVAAAYSDYQTINFVNPASYGNISYLDTATLKVNPGAQRNTLFDIGAEVDTRILKESNPPAKYSQTNLLVSYLQLGLPIKLRKLNRRGIFLGVAMGLRPVSRINYKVFNTGRLPGIDSALTVYEGTGGVSEANIGAGIRIKNFNIGFNTGYRFGNKNYSTSRSLLNDTVLYYQSRSASESNFGGVFFNAGMQYEIGFRDKKDPKLRSVLRLGAYGNLKRNMNADEDVIRETVTYDEFGAPTRVDSVFEKNEKGKVVYPATFGAGFTYQDKSNHWLFGADYETTYWNDYRFFDKVDNVKNSWKIKAGADYFPADLRTPLKKYFSYVRYRAGVYYGSDYIDVDNKLSEFGVTFGAGFPLKLRRGYYETQASVLNTAIEFGSRGGKQNSLRENIFRISVGLSLSDLWFNRSKYY
ncbi:MAG: hypothetical protein QM791_20375 [Ferruginibacter sp.]